MVARLAGRPVVAGPAIGAGGAELRALVLAVLLRRHRPASPRTIAQALIESGALVADRDLLAAAIARELAAAAAPLDAAVFTRIAGETDQWGPSPGFLAWLAGPARRRPEDSGIGAPDGTANDA